MKRKFLLFIAALLFSGVMYAQDYHFGPDFDYHAYQRPMTIIGQVYFNDVIQNSADIEIASFVGDEVRGRVMLIEPFPNEPELGFFAYLPCYYNAAGETFTFKAYDHATMKEYDVCTTTAVGRDDGYGNEDYPYDFYFTVEEEPTYGPDYPWIPVTENDYEGEGMLVVAQVKINGQVVDRASYEVGAFCGEECRAISGDELDDWTDDNLGYFAFMNILGNNGDIINFYLYDLENDCNFAGSCSTVVELENGGELGLDIYGGDIFVLNFVTVNTYIKTIEACTTNGGWYLISSPIGDVDPDEVDGMLENSYDLYRFNQSVEKEWENYKDTEYGHNHFGLELGRGYLYANSNKTDLIFTGDAYDSDGEIDLIYDENSTDFPGWNLIGNPFADTAYIDRALFYVMNDAREEVEAGTGNVVGAMEGIFVVAEAEGESVTFSTEDPGKAIHQLVVNLNGSNRGGSIDRAIVRFENNHFLPKFQLFEDNTKLYIPQDGKDYAVVSAEDHGELPMNFKAAKNGSYTISFNTENVTMSYLHLIDNLTGNDVDLIATPSYTFNAQTNDYASRFKLVFATGESTSDDFAFISDGSLIINGQGTLQVFDVTGRMISSNRIDGLHTVSTNGMAAGVYMLNLINGNNAKTQKIVVK
jgi:hypothetical protein